MKDKLDLRARTGVFPAEETTRVKRPGIGRVFRQLQKCLRDHRIQLREEIETKLKK